MFCVTMWFPVLRIRMFCSTYRRDAKAADATRTGPDGGIWRIRTGGGKLHGSSLETTVGLHQIMTVEGCVLK